MTECVRVIGFTDLRIEHILLLLCCYCNHNDSVSYELIHSLEKRIGCEESVRGTGGYQHWH